LVCGLLNVEYSRSSMLGIRILALRCLSSGILA
jgi:hypothetical protein